VSRTFKGVKYDAGGCISRCLFCDIADGAERNPLWYQDDDMCVFVPRDPAATVHLLLIPQSNNHIRNTDGLNASHVPLLERMRRVALEQLQSHAPYYGSGQRRLPGKGPAPPYLFPRGPRSPEVAPTAHDWQPTAAFDASRVLLCFHRAPFNSIDHLHLHALYKPFWTLGESVHFFLGSPWVMTLDAAVAHAARRPAPHVAGAGAGVAAPSGAISVGLEGGPVSPLAPVAGFSPPPGGLGAAISAAADLAAAPEPLPPSDSAVHRPGGGPGDGWSLTDDVLAAAGKDVLTGTPPERDAR